MDLHARIIAAIIDYHGDLVFDSSKPDGTPRKLLNTSRLDGLGWKARITLAAGMEDTYRWFVEHHAEFRQ